MVLDTLNPQYINTKPKTQPPSALLLNLNPAVSCCLEGTSKSEVLPHPTVPSTTGVVLSSFVATVARVTQKEKKGVQVVRNRTVWPNSSLVPIVAWYRLNPRITVVS